MIRYQVNKISDSFISLINQQNLSKILVAFSGGQDSVFLTYLLEKLIKHQRINISYIYIDHQWKKNSYQQIEYLVSYLKSKLNNNIYIYQIEKTVLSEEMCRQNRHHIIINHAIKYNYELIITGHSLTDKIETFLHSIVRGSGIESFNSLNIKNITKRTTIFRPLISIERKSIYWICKKLHLPIWSDVTNYLLYMERNRIRQELIPYMKKYMNIKVESNISHLINNYLYENDYIKQNVVKLYTKIVNTNKISIKHTELKKQNIIIQIRTIQLFYFHNFQTYINHKRAIKIAKIITNKILKPIRLHTEKHFELLANSKWIYIRLIK